MDLILAFLGIIGIAAIAIAAYIFTVAARNYVSDDNRRHRRHPRGIPRPYVSRSNDDRRSGQPVTFPLTVNGALIPSDRRRTPDRRKAPAF